MPFITLFKGHDPHFAAAHHTGYWDFVRTHPDLQKFQTAFTHEFNPTSHATIGHHIFPQHGNGYVALHFLDYGRNKPAHIGFTTQHEGKTKTTTHVIGDSVAEKLRAFHGY